VYIVLPGSFAATYSTNSAMAALTLSTAEPPGLAGQHERGWAAIAGQLAGELARAERA
jgi:hypothetical protein